MNSCQHRDWNETNKTKRESVAQRMSMFNRFFLSATACITNIQSKWFISLGFALMRLTRIQPTSFLVLLLFVSTYFVHIFVWVTVQCAYDYYHHSWVCATNTNMHIAQGTTICAQCEWFICSNIILCSRERSVFAPSSDSSETTAVHVVYMRCQMMKELGDAI